MRSRFWWASFSNRTKSCISTGPRGPAVMLFWLSETGMPLSVVSVGRLATDYSLLRDIEIPATQTALRQRYSCFSQCRLLTELRLRETGREWKCMHRLRDDFGSIAVIAPVLLKSPKSRTSLSCRCPALRRKPEPCPHIHEGLGESIHEHVVVV